MVRFIALAGFVLAGLSGCALSDQAEFSRKADAGIPYDSGTADTSNGTANATSGGQE